MPEECVRHDGPRDGDVRNRHAPRLMHGFERCHGTHSDSAATAAAILLDRARAARVALILPLFLDDFWVLFTTRVLILGILALSFDLVWGYAGILSFGQALFFGMAGYLPRCWPPSWRSPRCSCCCRSLLWSGSSSRSWSRRS